jgi:hypothetical protein
LPAKVELRRFLPPEGGVPATFGTPRSRGRSARMTMLQKLLMMRRPGVVGLDAFQFHGFEYARLSLHLFFEKLDELVLAGHNLVQLLDLMFEVGDAGFEPFKPL